MWWYCLLFGDVKKAGCTLVWKLLCFFWWAWFLLFILLIWHEKMSVIRRFLELKVEIWHGQIMKGWFSDSKSRRHCPLPLCIPFWCKIAFGHGENLQKILFSNHPLFNLGVSKKTGKLIKPRKPEKNNRKNRTKKNRLNFWKNRPVRFYKQKTKKTEPNWNRQKTEPKPSQTGKTEPKPRKPSQTGLNRFFP